MFGILTAGIAIGNLIGGWSMRRMSLRMVAVLSLAVVAGGCALASQARGPILLAGAQMLIGLGVGAFFAPGIKATGLAAGQGRRGLGMGIFGVAFSAGLAAAAFIAARAAAGQWQAAYVVATYCSLVGLVVMALVRLPPSQEPPNRRLAKRALRLPVLIGAVGTISQYGTVGFLTLFAVQAWGFSPIAAAALLAVGRVFSAPGKIAVGTLADRFGGRSVLRGVALLLLVTGLAWSLGPASPAVTVSAVIFVATVSALFPIANLVALERFGEQGAMLGVYRSAQIALGSLGAFLIGFLAERLGLRIILTLSVLLPLALFVLIRQNTQAT
jgi:MFS family permease